MKMPGADIDSKYVQVRIENMIYKKTNELKTISREKMLGKYGTAVGAFLFIRALFLFATDLCRAVANPTGLILVAILFVLALIEGVFVYGEQGIYMKIASGQETKMNDMFAVFKGDADKAIFARFIYVMMTYIPVTVSMLAIRYAANNKSMLIPAFLITLVLMILMTTLLLTYSQVILVMHDFPQLGVVASYRRSREMMRGRKSALLKLVLSFIPMHLLGILSFMAGELFIHPYYKLSLTEFYFDTVRAPSQKSVVDEAEIDITV